ncbi:MAG: hypothetical protein ACI8P3_004470 [Saprospiraceae bacterium]|jgi:hypothetical protein
MKEDFLHYLWRMRKFDHIALKTTDGETINIQSTGAHNLDAGPDFSNARIQIGDMLWAGNVEIHIKASEWYSHKHQNDKAYDNVILHVVFDEDQPVFRKNGERIPCLEIKKRVPAKVATIYQKLQSNELWIPCQHQFSQVPEITKNLWLDRLLVERLESKTIDVVRSLERNKNNWEETFYQFLAKGFGVKVNTEPFEQLAKSLPMIILSKHKTSLIQLEALLFGQSGMLENTFEEEYPIRLQKEYAFLRKKHRLNPIPGESWKFMRMRPANFPSIRIAQFATLVYQSAHLFSKILAAKNVKELENMFEVKISNYWQTHYIFDKLSIKRNKALGKNSIHLLIINTIIPFLFLYGKMNSNEGLKEKALQLLEAISPEQNAIISEWKKLGADPKSAYQTQALLQLKKHYCDKKNCLNCSIGYAILKG